MTHLKSSLPCWLGLLVLCVVLTLTLAFAPIAQAQQDVRLSEAPPAGQRTIIRLVDGSSNITHVCYGPQFLTTAKSWSIASGLTGIVVATNVATMTMAAVHGMPIGKLGAAVTITGGLEADTWAAADITSVVDLANTSTITFAAVHGLDTNDLISFSLFTTDTDLNGDYIFNKTNTTVGTITTADVADDTYNAASDPTMLIGLGDDDANGTYVVATVPSTTTLTLTFADVLDGALNEYSGLTVTMTQPRPPLTTDVVWDVKRHLYDASDNPIGSGWAVGLLVSGAVVRQPQKFACTASAAVVYH